MTASTAGTGGNPRLNYAIAAGSTILATVIYALDTTIANVALPHIQGTMSTTQEQISWVLTSYIIAGAVMTAPTAVLARRYGRRKVFAAAVIGFTIASMLVGMASSLTEIVLFRFLQGGCGAALVPLSQAILLDTTSPEKRGQAMAWWGVGVMAGPVLGPTLGGYLTEIYNWRWVFFINLPIGIITLIGILAAVPETKPDRSRGFDYFGFILLSFGLIALQLMLDRGELRGWFQSTEIIVEAGIVSVCLYMFLVHILTFDRPLIDPGLFRDRNMAVGTIFIVFVALQFFSSLALMPPLTQNLLGFPVQVAGLILAPRGIGQMVSMLIIGQITAKLDNRLLIFLGLLVNAYSLWLISRFSPEVTATQIAVTGMLQGAGLGLLFVPLTNVTFSTLNQRYTTEGTVMFSLMRNIGSGIGITMVITLLARHSQMNHALLAESVTPFMQNLPNLWRPDTAAGVLALNIEVSRQAAFIGYMNAFRIMMWISLAIIPLLLLFKIPPRAPIASANEPIPAE